MSGINVSQTSLHQFRAAERSKSVVGFGSIVTNVFNQPWSEAPTSAKAANTEFGNRALQSIGCGRYINLVPESLSNTGEPTVYWLVAFAKVIALAKNNMGEKDPSSISKAESAIKSAFEKFSESRTAGCNMAYDPKHPKANERYENVKLCANALVSDELVKSALNYVDTRIMNPGLPAALGLHVGLTLDEQSASESKARGNGTTIAMSASRALNDGIGGVVGDAGGLFRRMNIRIEELGLTRPLKRPEASKPAADQPHGPDAQNGKAGDGGAGITNNISISVGNININNGNININNGNINSGNVDSRNVNRANFGANGFDAGKLFSPHQGSVIGSFHNNNLSNIILSVKNQASRGATTNSSNVSAAPTHLAALNSGSTEVPSIKMESPILQGDEHGDRVADGSEASIEKAIIPVELTTSSGNQEPVPDRVLQRPIVFNTQPPQFSVDAGAQGLTLDQPLKPVHVNAVKIEVNYKNLPNPAKSNFSAWDRSPAYFSQIASVFRPVEHGTKARGPDAHPADILRAYIQDQKDPSQARADSADEMERAANRAYGIFREQNPGIASKIETSMRQAARLTKPEIRSQPVNNEVKPLPGFIGSLGASTALLGNPKWKK